MIVKFNPTGTHAHKGFLKVRFDLYPDIGDKTYPIHHVQVPVIPPEGYQGEVDADGRSLDQNDYNNWIDSLPKVWQLNPALCHFIKVNPDISSAELDVKIRGLFTRQTLLNLDDALSKSDAHNVQQIMKTKLGDGQVVSKFEVAGKDALNARLSTLEIEV